MSSISQFKQQCLFSDSRNQLENLPRHAPVSNLGNYMNLQSNRINNIKVKLLSNKSNIHSIHSISSYATKESIITNYNTKAIRLSSNDNSKHDYSNVTQVFENKLKAITNKRTKENSSLNNTNTSASTNNRFLNRSQEIRELIQKPLLSTNLNNNKRKSKITTLITKKQSFNYLHLEKQHVYDINIHEDFFDKNSLNKSALYQKLNHMQKVINKQVNKSPNNTFKNNYCNSNNHKGKNELFTPTPLRELKNKMNDLKKFKFFINYQERKGNDEKRAEFIANNLAIVTKIKQMVNNEKPAEEEEDISIEGLIE